MEHEHLGISLSATGEPVDFSRGERERHLYIVGKSGSGKSTVLYHLACEDIARGEGVALIEPHGDLAEAIADAVPPERTHQVCYLDVADRERPVGFNPLAGVSEDKHSLAAAGMVSAFRQLWAESWGQRLEHFLFNGVMALLAHGGATLIDLPRLYTDGQFRERAVDRVRDRAARHFWKEEFPSYDARFRAEASAPILNRVGRFAASPNLRLILGQVSPKFSLARAMDGRQIFIANLARGRIGEGPSNVLGSLIVSHLELLTMARSEKPPAARVPFFVHVDEFQSFATDAFASLLSEARKFGTHFCLANQYTDRLMPDVRAAVFGNVGSLMVFRVGAADAELLAPEFHPLPPHEFAGQPPFSAWLKRSGAPNRRTHVSPPGGGGKRGATVRRQSRRNFGRPVEQLIGLL